MMRCLIDTGPLVALLDRSDHHHVWARTVLGTIAPPVYTCEAVLTEVAFLMRRVGATPDALLRLVASGAVAIDFRLRDELDRVRELLRRFESVPMALADACLVRMTELDRESMVLTLDGDFRIYRRDRRHRVPCLMPESSASGRGGSGGGPTRR